MMTMVVMVITKMTRRRMDKNQIVEKIEGCKAREACKVNDEGSNASDRCGMLLGNAGSHVMNDFRVTVACLDLLDLFFLDRQRTDSRRTDKGCRQ